MHPVFILVHHKLLHSRTSIHAKKRSSIIFCTEIMAKSKDIQLMHTPKIIKLISNPISTKTCHLFNGLCKLFQYRWNSMFVPPQFSIRHAALTHTLMIWITRKTCGTNALEATQWVLTQRIYATRICRTFVDIQTANLVGVTSGARWTFTVEASGEVGAKSTTGA